MADRYQDALLEMVSNLVNNIEKLSEQMGEQARAMYYLGDCYGAAADKINTGSVKLDTKATIPKNNPIVEKLEPYTLDQIREIMNKYAKKHGREKALALVRKYEKSMNLKLVKESDYHSLAIEAAQ